MNPPPDHTTLGDTLSIDDVDHAIWDAIVIGAGPAGSIAAHALARRGRRVLLVDRAAFPRDKACGGCFNRAAIDALQRAGLGSVIKDIGGRPYDRFALAAGGRRADLPLPPGMVMSRRAFDAALLRAAVDEGVELLTRTSAKVDPIDPAAHRHPPARSVSIQHHAPPHDVQHQHAHRRAPAARLIIDATGITGRASDIDWSIRHASRIGLAATAPRDAAGFDSYPAGVIHMACAKGGYVGLARNEDQSLTIAAALDPPYLRARAGPADAVDAILQDAGLPRVQHLDQLDWHGTPALTRRRDTLGQPRLLLVGDAAGYVEPFTGEGMAWAMTSALHLAPLADHAIAQGWRDDILAQWAAAHRRLVARRQRMCRFIAAALRRPWLVRAAVAMLNIAPALGRPFTGPLGSPLLSETS